MAWATRQLEGCPQLFFRVIPCGSGSWQCSGDYMVPGIESGSVACKAEIIHTMISLWEDFFLRRAKSQGLSLNPANPSLIPDAIWFPKHCPVGTPRHRPGNPESSLALLGGATLQHLSTAASSVSHVELPAQLGKNDGDWCVDPLSTA